MLARLFALAGRMVRGLALLTVFVACGYLAFNFWVHRGVTPVPELVGLSEPDARARLESSGLEWHLAEGSDWSAAVPAGSVLETRPRGGSLVKRGAHVEVVLSLGARRITAPDLVGKALAAARVTLESSGLEVGDALSVVSARGAAGTVVGQQPAAGAELPPGTQLDLLVALDTSPDTWVMPDLVAHRYDPVRSALEDRGFRFGSVTFEPYEGVTAGTILRQSPLPGHPLRRADAIALVVAGQPFGAGE